MKRFKISAIFISLSFLTAALAACTDPGTDSSGGGASACEVFPAEYTDAVTISDFNGISEFTGDLSDNPVENGICVSPYYTMKVNGAEVPVYAARSANGIHSFAYLDVKSGEADGSFSLDVELSPTDLSTVLDDSSPEVVVLPERNGVAAEIEGETVRATIDKFGSFSFAFNKNYIEPLTLMVKEYEEFSAPEGYTVQNVEPGVYTADQTDFTQENTVYYFGEGTYKTDCIRLPSNSVLYLERGAYIAVQPSEPTSVQNAITNAGAENISIEGRGLVDFSACNGGSDGNKSGIVFNEVKNVSLLGLTVINSQTWTMCFNACEDVHVKDIINFGYRTFADGVMLSDCADGVVEDCFIRTGDDAFETKSTTSANNGKYTDNILFQNNAAWTDKAVAYGCIYESSKDTQNVTFLNNSVGFALGTWSSHLGCNVIQMGNNPQATMHDIHFIGTEIYTSYNQAICNIYIGGSGGQGAGWGKVNKIYFRDITAKRNYGLVLNLRSYTQENTEIKNIYLDNVVSNGTLFTQELVSDDTYFKDSTQEGVFFSMSLYINTLDEE